MTLMQVLLGLCIGLAVSLIIAPFTEYIPCESSHTAYKNNIAVAKMTATKGSTRPHSRPRFASTELGIREKILFNIVTTEESVNSRAIAINITLTEDVPETLYFITKTSAAHISGNYKVPLISFVDDNIVRGNTLFRSIQYVYERYGAKYDWFVFAFDDVYINSLRILHLVNHVSVAGNELIGKPASSRIPEVSTCDIRSGIIVSSNVLQSLARTLPFCLSHSNADVASLDMTQMLQSCIARVAANLNTTCRSQVNELSYEFYFNTSMQSSDVKILNRHDMHRMLTIGRMLDVRDFYYVHQQLCKYESKLKQQELYDIQAKIVDIIPQTPEGNSSQSWPVDIDEPMRPRTRYDIETWTYFTENQIFSEYDKANVHNLSGADRDDILDIVTIALDEINLVSSVKYRLQHITNGYRRFDATRGMDYLLDLVVIADKNSSSAETVKRVGLLRPLGAVEIIPTPYVTESLRVHIVLPVAVHDRDAVLAFIDSFVRVCVDSGDNAELLVVLLYPSDSTIQNDDTDLYAVIKSTIAFYGSRFTRSDARISWVSVIQHRYIMGSYAAVTPPFAVVDSVVKRLNVEAMVFLCSVGMKLSMELLNRVRMNTIIGFQVFIPIGFWAYKSNLVYDHPPYPTNIEVSSKTGYFDVERADHASFYCADYLEAMRQSAGDPLPPVNLFELFLHHSSVHVLRAVEPALRLEYRDSPVCDMSKTACPPARLSASREQLALHVFEYKQKLDQHQVNVMHRQRGENVNQMKPD